MNQSSPHNLTITSSGQTVALHIAASTALFDMIVSHDFWEQFIPDITMSQDISRVNSVDVCEVNEGDAWQLSIDTSNIEHVIFRATMTETNITDLVVLVGYMLEQRRQLHGQYSMHGSTITKKGVSVAMIGGISGIGKTTLAMYAASKSWDLTSDEKFIIDGNGIMQGSVKRLMQTSKMHASIAKHNLDVAGLTIVNNTPIALFVIPIIAEGTILTIHEYSHDKSLWHIYEELTRDIRLVNGFTNNFTETIISLDNPVIAEQRLKTAHALSQSIPMVFVKGSVSDVFQFIERQTTSLTVTSA